MDGETTQIDELHGLSDADLNLRLKGMTEKADRMGIRVTEIVAEMPGAMDVFPDLETHGE
jgi:hypothetical protein